MAALGSPRGILWGRVRARWSPGLSRLALAVAGGPPCRASPAPSCPSEQGSAVPSRLSWAAQSGVPEASSARMAPKRVVNGYVEAKAAPAEVDTTEEEQLLEAFSLIANIDKAWCRAAPPSPGQLPPPKPAKGAPPGKVALDVMVQMSQRNLAGNRMRKFLSSAHIPEPQGDLSAFHWAPFPTELTGVAAVSPSPSGSRLLVVRNGEGEEKAVRLEVWGAGRLLKEVYVAPSVHRSVYADGTFEAFSWSNDETAVLYVAEEPAPKPRIFGKVKVDEHISAPAAAPSTRGRFAAAKAPPPPAELQGDGGSAAGTWKAVGEWHDDWGEQYTGKGRPLLFVLNISEGKVEKVEGIPEDMSVGQAVWAPPLAQEQSTLIFVGWSSTSSNFPTTRQLGFKYCTNRPSGLYAAKAPGSPSGPAVVKLTSAVSSALFPQFSPDGQLLVFLSAQASVETGVHLATNSLHSLKWPGDFPGSPPIPTGRGSAKAAVAEAGVQLAELPTQTIIDAAPRPEEAAGFPGLYCDSVTRQPWLADGKTLLLTTAWRSTQAIIAVNVDSGRLSRLTPEGPISWKLLDVEGNTVVAGASTPACPTKLMLGRMNAGFFKQEGWLWSEISTPHVEYAEEVESSLRATEFEVLSVSPSPASLNNALTQGSKLPFEAIFLRKAPDLPPPLCPAPRACPWPLLRPRPPLWWWCPTVGRMR